MNEVLNIDGMTFVERISIDQQSKMIARMEEDACFVYINKGQHDVISPNEHISMKEREAALMKCGNYIACAVVSTPIHPLEMLVFHLDPRAIRKAFGAERLATLISNDKTIKNISSVKIAVCTSKSFLSKISST